MIQRKKATKEQVAYTIAHAEFPEDIRTADKQVAVVMTQNWCPQWFAMQLYLKRLETEVAGQNLSLVIYEIVYNTEPYFREFLEVKERAWKNKLIPYIRYYREGVLVDESNFVTLEDFLSRCSGKI